MLSIYELSLLFKLSKEGDAAICQQCKAEVLWGGWWSHLWRRKEKDGINPGSLCNCAEDCSCAGAALRWGMPSDDSWAFSHCLSKWNSLQVEKAERGFSFFPYPPFQAITFLAVLPIISLTPLVLNSCGSLSHTLFLGCSGKMWMLCIWKCSGTESHCWKSCCDMKKVKGGREDPTGFLLLRGTGMDVFAGTTSKSKNSE